MTKFISKKEMETLENDNKNTHYVGEIYPQIFSHSENFEFGENMPLEAAVLYLGAYQLENSLFPKQKCPVCGKEEVLIPYMCGGSVLSGCHTLQFYCLNCHEQFVTNDAGEYFRQICNYIKDNRDKLKPSPAFRDCTKM